MHIQNVEKFLSKNPIENLNLEKIKEIYNKVVDDLNYHNFLYYVKSQPIISDYEYDLLFDYLKKIETKFPEIKRQDSPSSRLTNQIQSELKKANHKTPLLSLENTYNKEEVNEKLEKYEKDFGIKYFYIEPKYDGLSIELIYENGYFKQAITRGDGFVGEDITENAKTINSLPLKISYKGELHIRGEVVVRKSIFEKINKERENQGLETYSNPRNLASGSLRQLDASITAQRQLDVICYEILDLNLLDEKILFHSQALDFLEKLGFLVYDFKRIIGDDGGLFEEITDDLSDDFQKKNLEGFRDRINKFLSYFQKRQSLTKEQILDVVNSEEIKQILDNEDIEFDGLVIKVNEEKYWSLIGRTEHHPKWAFAFKYPAKEFTTRVLDVELSVGRTGNITPVAILEPVNIGGVIVQRASLHNFDFIKEKDIHIQDYVLVKRSGEVIPYVVQVIKEKRVKYIIDNLSDDYLMKKENLGGGKGNEYKGINSYLEYIKKYKLNNVFEGNLIKIIEISYCPVCGGETFHPDGEVALKCINISCPAQIKEKLSYFVSKNGLDIEGLSEKTIELLLEVGLIKDFADIFTLKDKKQELLSLPGFKQKKVENILKSIEDKEKILLNIFLQALGIDFVGKKTAKLIVENYKTDDFDIDFQKFVDFLISDKGEEFLLSINGIGPKVVHSVKKFFHEEHNKKVINKLLKFIQISYLESKKGKFSGKNFVITGSIPNISRQQIEQFILEKGGELSNQITLNTDLLIVGEKPGNNKIKLAEKNNIKKYDLYKFLEENGFNFPENRVKEESLF